MMMRKEQRKMGLTHVQVTVRNPADAERSWEGAFLVDTGAIDSLVPRERLEQIGLKPKGRRLYGFADGREAAMDITVAELEFMGEVIGSTIVFGAEGSEPLLGVTALESMGIEIDPLSQQLRKLPSIHLKATPAANFPVPAELSVAPEGPPAPGVLSPGNAGILPASGAERRSPDWCVRRDV